ncbi:MAG: NAD(P)(+) transhydrogenase (Re/Si-specific) subunit beta [Planctomycetota bacterium]
MTEILHLIAAVLFITGLKLMGKAPTARLGNTLSSAGMLAAVAGSLITTDISWPVVIVAALVGGTAGGFAAVRVKMTGMPELVALFNGLGGLASAAVAAAELLAATTDATDLDRWARLAAAAALVVGAVAFSGSLIALGKLAGKVVKSGPVTFPVQIPITAATLAGTIAAAAAFALNDNAGLASAFLALALAMTVGVLGVIRIGGGDMPVVVSLLNSYSGVAAALAGLALDSPVLVVAGTLVGASGLMLTSVMCKAMNRSLSNVLFAGFGAPAASGTKAGPQGEARSISINDTYFLLEAARSILVVPGYGMAVAQAQHAAKELADTLSENGADVRFVIHPVAGRMPGHMNVLLAEAGVEYDLLAEPQDVNPSIDSIDVVIVIGANDVVNPDAREDETSPLYGMPIIDVDRARNVIVLKRSMNPGFAGVQNALFFRPNTRMLFGDAKASLVGLSAEFAVD